MSHEFRTPLNSILSLAACYWIAPTANSRPSRKNKSTFIRGAAEDLSELVNDLLDLAKVEAGKVSVRPQTFEAAELFGALARHAASAVARNPAVSLVFDDPDDVPPLLTDESKVSQILRNFISNALKFTERGEVRVSAASGDADTVVFRVADTGIGIAAEDREVIFQEFAQAGQPAATVRQGHGLGSSAVRRLAELLGGSIEVSGSPGVGSTFALILPRDSIRDRPKSLSCRRSARSLDPMRQPVLIVEDNAETLFIYGNISKARHFKWCRLAPRRRRGRAWCKRFVPSPSCWTFCWRAKAPGT